MGEKSSINLKKIDKVNLSKINAGSKQSTTIPALVEGGDTMTDYVRDGLFFDSVGVKGLYKITFWGFGYTDKY